LLKERFFAILCLMEKTLAVLNDLKKGG